MLRALTAACLILIALGCEASVPDGRFACDVDDDCPPGQRCDLDRDRCHLPDGG